jgi:hypothetical protein
VLAVVGFAPANVIELTLKGVIFDRLKLRGVVTPAALARTTYEPAVLLAVALPVVAFPLRIIIRRVVGLLVGKPPVIEALAPLAGHVKSMRPPFTASSG